MLSINIGVYLKRKAQKLAVRNNCFKGYTPSNSFFKISAEDILSNGDSSRSPIIISFSRCGILNKWKSLAHLRFEDKFHFLCTKAVGTTGDLEYKDISK